MSDNPGPRQQQWQDQQQWTGQPPHQQWTGQPPAPPVPPQPEKPRSWFSRHKILTALLVIVGLIVVANLASGGDEPAPGSSSPAADEQRAEEPAADQPAEDESVEEPAEDEAAEEPAPEEEAAEEPAAEEPANPGLNTPVRDGTFEFTVTEVETGVTTVGEGFTQEEPQGQFVVVHLSVSNIGDQAQHFFDSNQTLVDEQGREHSTSSAAMWLEDNDLWLNEVNPGNSVEGVLLFDIPADATPTQLRLHDSAFSGGVLVDLR